MEDQIPSDLDNLTRTIIGAAFDVSHVLGHGFLEAVYRNALMVELTKRGMTVTKEVSFPVLYSGQRVGLYLADLVVANVVIVEIKAVGAFSPAHSAQVLNYLQASRLPIGLLLNFGRPRIEVKRLIRSDPARRSQLASEVS
jgi:GxxExxY protein